MQSLSAGVQRLYSYQGQGSGSQTDGLGPREVSLGFYEMILGSLHDLSPGTLQEPVLSHLPADVLGTLGSQIARGALV